MRYSFIAALGGILLLNMAILYASEPITQRIAMLSNDRVLVWKTIVYPNKNQELKMHHHEHDRVVVAFNEGILKITNDKGQSHLMKLEKEKAYYLKKDISGELHTDENLSDHPIKVMVVELLN